MGTNSLKSSYSEKERETFWAFMKGWFYMNYQNREIEETQQAMSDFPNKEGGNAADIPQTLMDFSDAGDGTPIYTGEDIPQILPSFPDMEDGIPSYPQPIAPTIYRPSYLPQNRCCKVRFFHAAAQAGPVNVSVGAQRVASNLSFGNFSPYYCFGEGFRRISIVNARNNRVMLLQKTVPFHVGETITYAIVNNASTGALELVVVNDTACPGQMGGFACLKMANFLLGDTSLDLLMGDGRVLFSDVRYKESTISRRLRPGRYSFYVANTPNTIQPRIDDVELDDGVYRISERYLPGYGEVDPVISFSLRAARGVTYTAYIIGQANIDEVQVIISAGE